MNHPIQPGDHSTLHETVKPELTRDPIGIAPDGIPADGDTEASYLPSSHRQETATTAQPYKRH